MRHINVQLALLRVASSTGGSSCELALHSLRLVHAYRELVQVRDDVVCNGRMDCAPLYRGNPLSKVAPKTHGWRMMTKSKKYFCCRVWLCGSIEIPSKVYTLLDGEKSVSTSREGGMFRPLLEIYVVNPASCTANELLRSANLRRCLSWCFGR